MFTTKIAATICSILLVGISASYSQPTPTPKVDLLTRLSGKAIFKIEDNEVNVAGQFIKRIEIGKNSAIITYFNKLDTSKQPKFEFRVFNGYGFEIGRFEDKWVIDSLQPGDTRKENKGFLTHRLSDFFEHSDFKLPEDWDVPVYVLITGEAK